MLRRTYIEKKSGYLLAAQKIHYLVFAVGGKKIRTKLSMKRDVIMAGFGLCGSAMERGKTRKCNLCIFLRNTIEILAKNRHQKSKHKTFYLRL